MDVTEREFQTAVIDRSYVVPVVVDFWAEWCGPCRQLAPVLERAVADRNGTIDLVKVDTDANPGLSRSFAIHGIPAVKAFKDGELVLEFVGAQPRAEIDKFLDALLPSEADGLVAAGDEASLARAVELEPTRADAAVPLARILHARKETDEALRILARVPGSFAASGLTARIGLERGGEPDLSEAFARYDAGDAAGALDLLLAALSTADGARDDIRKVVIGILDELGVESELARDARRRLAAALY